MTRIYELLQTYKGDLKMSDLNMNAVIDVSVIEKIEKFWILKAERLRKWKSKYTPCTETHNHHLPPGNFGEVNLKVGMFGMSQNCNDWRSHRISSQNGAK